MGGRFSLLNMEIREVSTDKKTLTKRSAGGSPADT